MEDKIKDIKQAADNLHGSGESYFEKEDLYLKKRAGIKKELNNKLDELRTERIRALFSGMKKCSKAGKAIPLEYIEEFERMLLVPSSFDDLFDDLFNPGGK